VETYPSKNLKINTNLIAHQEQKLFVVLKDHTATFAWDYKDMKGIHIKNCTYQIYVKIEFVPIKKPQRKMNPSSKDVVNGELKKLLDA
jgi:hypothetical protein